MGFTKRIVILLFLIISLSLFVNKKPALAANGCGGTSWCGGTKIIPTYTCNRQLNGTCLRVRVGQKTVDCTSTEDSCETHGYFVEGCNANCEVIYLYQQPTTCCTNGSGGWGCPSFPFPTRVHHKTEPLKE